ncbi:MAG TPA: FecR domain-containing protein [Steroidobacteraceae bacterium]|nr:FecR domain-containing protein [Steroidobacteraceae bacterium]
MSDIVRLRTQTQIDNEAAVWTWRLDAGALTQTERGELEAWLRRDARHRRAFEELGRTWSVLDRLRECAEKEQAGVAAPAARHTFVRSKPYWLSAAAAVLVVALGAALWLAERPGTEVLATAVGQQRHVTLADGSRITLNTNTLLTVNLSRARRVIDLRRGEAHFDVTHDAARPFVVHAGDTLIRDLGTQFEVRVHPDHDVDVLVNEGRVEVQGSGTARALSAGQQLLIAGPHLKVMSVSSRQIDDDLAWRQGALVFEGEPLSQAITEVERYTRTRIVLSGPEVASLPISGRFRTDDVPGFLQALQEALPVRVSRKGPESVSIAPR